MAKVGGPRPGAGRPKGSLSRRHVEVRAGAASEGLTPVEYMLFLLRDEDAGHEQRAWAAEKAAPFLHPRPAPVSRPIVIELHDTSTFEGVSKALVAITQAAASGEVAPSEAQSPAALIEAQRKAIETSELAARVAALEERTGRK
jgi:hypothetical protein